MTSGTAAFAALFFCAGRLFPAALICYAACYAAAGASAEDKAMAMEKAARLQKIDIIRGLALLGAAVYHFSWDLAYFGYLPEAAAQSGALYLLARSVAACFLFVAGFCLFLAHGRGVRVRAFARRLAALIGCAALVSLASYIFFPQGFIYFGILHELALAAPAGLLFLSAPLALNCAVILLCLFAPHLAALCGADLRAPALWWLGLSRAPAPSFDYVPFFPWFACALAGQTLAAFMARRGLLRRLREGVRPQCLSRLLQFLGRHSLALYLLHQPLLLAGLALYAEASPPSFSAARAALTQNCIAACLAAGEYSACRGYCVCAAGALVRQKLIGPYSRGEISPESPPVAALRRQCAARNFAAPERR